METDETLERWQFDIYNEDATNASGASSLPGGPPARPPRKNKTEKEVQGEIREIMKQITSSVTFLPILDEPCELLAGTVERRGLLHACGRYSSSPSPPVELAVYLCSR
jgi:hypothetical protein